MLPTPSGRVIGGAASNCVTLVLELRRKGVDVELLTSVSEDDLALLARSPLYEIVTAVSPGDGGLLGKGLGTLRALRQGLKRRLKKKHFDVIHSHSGTYPYAAIPLVADYASSVRVHSLYCPLGAKGGVYSNWWEKPSLARFAFQRLDRVIAVTENVQRSVQGTGLRPEKIELVPMCVDTDRFRPRPRPHAVRYFPDDPGCSRVLFVGNASEEKGLIELLLAIKILADRNRTFSLVAAVENQSKIRAYSVGYDRAQDLVRRFCLEGYVRFIGLVDAIEELYAEADILVIPWKTSRGPSDYPMVVLEAMAMGKCIVSTPVGGCPELLAAGRAGILTEGYSAESIAAAIQRVTQDESLRRRLEAAAVARAQEFSVRASAGRLMALYEHLLQRKAARHAHCAG